MQEYRVRAPGKVLEVENLHGLRHTLAVEKKKPHDDLLKVQRLIAEGKYEATKTALRSGVNNFGLTKEWELGTCVQKLSARNFYKSMTTRTYSRFWQDVYRMAVQGAVIISLEMGDRLTMRDKKWVDCPVCGAKDAMRYKKGLRKRFNPPGYEPIEVKGLDGAFCRECGDGFWSLKSKAAIAKQLAENMATQDSKRIVASEMVSVKEAAKVIRVTPQGIHKMMDEGRIRYVYATGLRFPIRKDLTEKAVSFKGLVAAGKRHVSSG